MWLETQRLINFLRSKYPSDTSVIRCYAHYLEHVKHDLNGAAKAYKEASLIEEEGYSKHQSLIEDDQLRLFRPRKRSVSEAGTLIDDFNQPYMTRTNSNIYLTPPDEKQFSLSEPDIVSKSDISTSSASEAKKQLIVTPDSTWCYTILLLAICIIYAIAIPTVVLINDANHSEFTIEMLNTACKQSNYPHLAISLARQHDLSKMYVSHFLVVIYNICAGL